MLAFLAAVLAAAPSADIPSIPTDQRSLEVRSAQSPAPASPATEAPTTAAPANEAAALESAVPWWEKITVTVDDKGTQQNCRYETSVSPTGGEACDKEMAASLGAGGKGGAAGLFKKVTFERRFTPGGKPDAAKMKPGDTLLGRQVMFLSIDATGAIDACHIVSTAGDVPPAYGCDDAKKEKFKAEASADPAARSAFMTISAYGHTESIA